jgi:hypothetical protein
MAISPDLETNMHRRDFLKTAVFVAAGTGTLSSLELSSGTANTKLSAATSDLNELVVRYIAAWNEHAAERRLDLIVRTWTEDGSYIDARRASTGYDGLDRMIQTAQQQSPGYRLRLASGIEAHNGHVRFRWAAGASPEAPLYFAGTDFALIASDGRLKSVIGFLDAAPAPRCAVRGLGIRAG